MAIFLLSATTDAGLLASAPPQQHRTVSPRQGARHATPQLLAGGGKNFDWRTVRAGLVAEEQKRDFLQQQQQHQQQDSHTPKPPEENIPPAPPSPPADAWWVHELAVPERGCVLLVQPGSIFPEQPLLHRAAVLLLEHSTEKGGGTVGLLLGRSTNVTVSKLLEKRNEPSLRAFASQPLWIGGNVLTQGRGLRVLTRRIDVPGGIEVVLGLYECSPVAAARMVSIGAAPPEDFHFYAATMQVSVMTRG